MKIIYLAWGSLYWNPDFLPIASWIQSNLFLPLEFSRISDNGKGRLTLVIDEKNGMYNNIWYAFSKENNVNKAINYLKKREKTSLNNIAYINLKNGNARITNTSLKIANKIKEFAADNSFDVVIWTDLESNWTKIMNNNYTVARAYNYFKESDLETRLRILEYVYKAKMLTKIETNFSKYFFDKLK